MNYGDVALGVECALPAAIRLAPRKNRLRRAAAWLLALLAGRN